MEIGWFILASPILAIIWSFLIPKKDRPTKLKILWRNSLPLIPISLALFVLSILKYQFIGILEAVTFVFTTSVVLFFLFQVNNVDRQKWQFLKDQIGVAAKSRASWLGILIFGVFMFAA